MTGAMAMARGWRIVLAAFVTQLLVLGTSIYSFGVFVKPLAAEFGASRTAVSGAFMAYAIVGAIAAPFVGAVLARRSIRKVMLAGVALTAAGFGLLSTATALWQAYVYFGLLVGGGAMLAGALPCTALIVNWFDKDRGLALGISLFGASAGAPLFVTLATEITERFDWRWTASAYAIAIAVLLPPLVWLLVRDRPPGAAAPAPAVGPRGGFALGLLRDRRLWPLAAVIGFGAAPSVGVIQSLHAHATDLGFPPQTAALLVAGMTMLGAFAKPLFGRLADAWSLRGAVCASFALQAAALATLSSGSGLAALVVGAALFGLGYGGFAPLISLLLSAVFGGRRFPEVMGLMTTLLLPFTLVGLPFASWVQDSTGSYASAFAAFIGFMALGGLALTRVDLSGDAAPVRPSNQTV
jgi:MFS family permease